MSNPCAYEDACVWAAENGQDHLLQELLRNGLLCPEKDRLAFERIFGTLVARDDQDSLECLLSAGYQPTAESLFACVWENALECFAEILHVADDAEEMLNVNVSLAICATGRNDMLQELVVWASEHVSFDELQAYLLRLLHAEHADNDTLDTIEAALGWEKPPAQFI